MGAETVRGMLTVDELRQKVESGEVETVITVFTDLYGRFMGKRVTGEFFLEHTAQSGMHACDYLLTVDMPMEPIPGYQYASWELGYGDFHCVPDLNTLRMATWLDKSALVICDIHDEKKHAPVSVAPRSVLGRQIAEAEKLGYKALGASELEYFIFDETYKSAREKQYAGG
jgi:glutamine synthetase